MAELSPVPISGAWSIGYTLDRHTVSAEFLGYDLNERPMFDTVRSPLGELLFRCKYRGDRKAGDEVATIAAEFVRARRITADVVVPVPPTRARSFQPLIHIGSRLASELEIVFDASSLTKVKDTPELKDVADMAARESALVDAFGVQGNALRGRTVLLLDDLYRSGASMNAAARALRDHGGVARVAAIALTRTRSRT
jgi:competence protein ComFC